MFRLLAVALAVGQIHGLAVVPGALDLEAPPPLFVKTAGGDNNTAFERYERFNYAHWKPDDSLYEGVPMVEKQVIVNGETVTYQDFDLTALTLDQFKQYFISTPEFLNGNGELSHSDEEAQKYL